MLFDQVSKYFSRQSEINFYTFLCADDPSYCKSSKINLPTIYSFYHKVEIKKFNQDEKYEDLILQINQYLTHVPLKSTPDYTPTITISKRYSNDQYLESSYLLLLVFSEHCVHCRIFLPTWETYSINFRIDYPQLKIAKV
ncbi:hypothetical protein HZS_565 [Henneguya salminicola]|nr:hypothetical protein HZS_565 [Henneguya salminicola]